MNVTSVTDAGVLLGSITTTVNSKVQSVSEGSSSFQDIWSAQAAKNTNIDFAPDVKAEKVSTQSQKNTSDRIAGEGKADDRSADATEKKIDTKETKTSEKVDGKDRTKDDQGAVSAEKEVDTKETSAEKTLDEKEVNSEDDLLSMMQALSAIIQEFAQKLQEILGMEPQDMEATLADLDMTAGDLLDTQKLGFFVVQQFGETDSLSLLTNEEALGMYKEVLNVLNDYSNMSITNLDDTSMELSVNELMDKIREGLMNSTDGNVEQLDVPDNLPLSLVSDVLNRNTIAEDTTNYASTVESSMRIAEDDGEETIASLDKNFSPELIQVATREGDTLGMEALLKADEESGKQGNDGKRQEDASSGNNFTTDYFVSQLNTISESSVEQLSEEAVNTTDQAREIANQILDYLRTQIRGDVEELEMQLHPASLGAVHISLVNKDGMLTANFVTENEQVKAVLEGQMIQLQERFDEQGIKVQAIEVSVASHGFEQNLEQEAQSEQRREENRPRPVRRLQIGPDFGLDDLNGLEDADRIAAEMLIANGGTVDYHA